MTYAALLDSKLHYGSDDGFAPTWTPDFLFDFQEDLVEWSIRKGRAALFADCGLGKTPMQLVWAQNVAEHTGGRVLVVTPLAVAFQTEEEAAKFGIEAAVSRDGKPAGRITVTNYDRLHLFNPADYQGMVCDESSAIKDFGGKRRRLVTEFMRKLPYRLLATATAAPNDYIELGTSSETLGYLGHMDMLGRFFTNKGSFVKVGGVREQWRFKGHAETPFWQWVASWARALRKPSDLGYSDDGFDLPALSVRRHLIDVSNPDPERLFEVPAQGLHEQRDEARRTITDRCETVAALLSDANPAVAWCNLNSEGDLLTNLIPGAVQVKGSDSVESKEEALHAFGQGEIRVLVTKPTIAGWGLNWQHCHRVAFFPTHSYEQYYQAVRRCWRFGQEHPVTVDVVTTEGGRDVLANLERKAAQASAMFDSLTVHMRDAAEVHRIQYPFPVEVPSWLS